MSKQRQKFENALFDLFHAMKWTGAEIQTITLKDERAARNFLALVAGDYRFNPTQLKECDATGAEFPVNMNLSNYYEPIYRMITLHDIKFMWLVRPAIPKPQTHDRINSLGYDYGVVTGDGGNLGYIGKLGR